MKKISIIIIIMILVTGCQTSDLADYKAAVETVGQIEEGVSTRRFSIDIEFDESGMSFEEQRDMSYFEKIEMVAKTQYDASNDAFKAKINNYFNFGGIGFDMIYYIEGNEILLKLPIMDKYLDVSMDIQSSKSYNISDDVFKVILDTWNAILKEEDVVSSTKAYVLTDKGKIKTTTYSINIDSSQFEVLKEQLIIILEDEKTINNLFEQSGDVSGYEVDSKEVVDYLIKVFNDIELSNFEGKAYVDFDGRLVKQVIICDLENTNTQTNDIKTIHINYEEVYDQLGEPQMIEIPVLTEEDYIKLDENREINDYFPKGLF